MIGVAVWVSQVRIRYRMILFDMQMIISSQDVYFYISSMLSQVENRLMVYNQIST